MTVVDAPMTRVRGLADGRLSAQCVVCGLYLVQLAGADASAAVAAFDVHFPSAEGARHTPNFPHGWHAATYGPGALSQ